MLSRLRGRRDGGLVLASFRATSCLFLRESRPVCYYIGYDSRMTSATGIANNAPGIPSSSPLIVIVWVITSLAFSYYVSNFANYSVIYGSLGAAIALLLYFYISATVLLLGAELNVAIDSDAPREDATDKA